MGALGDVFGNSLGQNGSTLNYLASFTLLSSGTITDVAGSVVGTVDHGGLSTVWSVEYGLTNSYGSTATGGTITAKTAVTKALTGLIPYTTYHWRLKAINAKGTSYSDDQTFVTIIPAETLDANTVAWFAADDLTSITKDGSNLVSSWNDKSGKGNHLLQATGTRQPLWVTPNIIRFNGTSQWMMTAPFTWARPNFIYMVVKILSVTALDRIFDGNLENKTSLYQTGTGNNYEMHGGAVGTGIVIPSGVYVITRFGMNSDGPNSKFQLNDESVLNITDIGSNGMNGFTLGKGGGGAGNAYRYSNIEVKEIICRKILDDANTQARIYAYLNAKHGVVVPP